MTTETTEPAELTGLFRDQLAAAEALGDLIQQNADLPVPYITIHQSMPEHRYTPRLDFQLETASDFETWRSALHIASTEVSLHATASNVWLAADGEHDGVRVHLSGFNIPLTRVQAEAPRDRDEVAA